MCSAKIRDIPYKNITHVSVLGLVKNRAELLIASVGRSNKEGMRGRGVYRGRGRGRGGYASGRRGGGGRSSYHTTGYNKHINKKWVRESPNDDDYNGLKEGSTSSTGYPIKSNASISTNSITEVNKSTASTYKWKRQSPEDTNSSESNSNEASANVDTIGNKKTTIKADSTHTNDMKQSASVSTQSKSSTHVSSVNKSNSWKRQSSEIDDDSNRKHAVFAHKGDNSWKRQKTVSEKKITPRKNERVPPVHNRKRKHTGTSGPRRINLSIPKEEGGALDSEDEDINNITSQKTLTDFCYQDTGRGRGGRGVMIRGRGRGRGRGRPTVKGNIGLVRVQDKNLSNTPICPTFRRGIPCNDPKCKLRHDVSTEASRPICVFFQRNGMCSKGDDCPFRHIKVPWNAEICPMFQKVGYCEDANCLLRHVDAKKSLS